jgi:hypothetical protein
MPSRSEMLGEGTIRGEKPLGVPWRLEPLNAPLPLACRLVGIFGAVVEIAMLAELCPTSPRSEVAGIPVPSSVDYGDTAFRMPMPCKADGAPDDRYVQIRGHRSSSGRMAVRRQPCRCTVPPCTSCNATHWPGSDPSDPAPAARADATCGARHGASHLLGCCDPRPACRHLAPRRVIDDGRRRIRTTDVFLEHRFIGEGEG